MTAKQYLQENKEEAKDIIRQYFENFIDDGDFNEEAYLDSAMEGELMDEINGQMFGDDEGLMYDTPEEDFEYFDQLVIEVLLEPGMAIAKAWFDENETKY